MSVYRTNEVQSNTISPEDEMRIILARGDEPSLKRMLVTRCLFFASAVVAVIRGDGPSIFWVVVGAILIGLVVHALTRRARLMRRLRNEGVDVSTVV